MATKEARLESQLRAIKVEKRKKAEAAHDKWQKEIKKERSIKLKDGVYNFAFGEGYGQSELSPKKVIDILNGPVTIVRHDWGGNVLDVYNNINITKNEKPQSVFGPRDKGRPAIVVCVNNKAVFSLAVYGDGIKGREIVIFPVSEVQAW